MSVPPETAQKSSDEGPNNAILDEVNRTGKWFHAKKTRPIWARQLTADETVRTLEGTEKVSAGDFLCRGEAGDVWPQKAAALEKRYALTDEVSDDGWRKYAPRPEAQGAMAVEVPHAFEVHASWGKLSGKPGDYLLKNFEDRDALYPHEVWIVDHALFEATYDAVANDE
jgi:hypothetical protein